jgi:hypothetical protein
VPDPELLYCDKCDSKQMLHPMDIGAEDSVVVYVCGTCTSIHNTKPAAEPVQVVVPAQRERFTSKVRRLVSR